MAKLVRIATCNLNQWAMDFDGNLERVMESIRQAKAEGATFRVGPELEISGYGCEDHFLETDTFNHTWESLAEILKSELSDGILLDIGAAIMHRNVSYNCRVFICNRKIVLIRPKMFMADDGNYREPRWFTAWDKGYTTEDYYVPRRIREICGQEKVPFGIAAISTNDTCLASETCEELFTPNAPHILFGLNGVEIVANGSGSHHQLRKLDTRIDLMKSATAKSGGVYLYANQQGCDGGRLYYDGCAMIWCNGHLMAQGTQFSLNDVEMVYANIDLEEVRSFRSAFASRSVQAASAEKIPRVDLDFDLSSLDETTFEPTKAQEIKILHPMEEIAYGPSSWLWDYLRRSAQRGFFLPLSGGADSASTAALVGIMCQEVVKKCKDGDVSVIQDVQKVTRRKDWVPATPEELAKEILYCVYMASEHSGEETLTRARDLAAQIGANFDVIRIDGITRAIVESFSNCTNKTPHMETAGGCTAEDLAMQNIQARSRMVMAYFMAQLMPWASGSSGSLLVLGSANVDEALRGYYTKYDCSAADINPIGGICKVDLKDFLKWAAANKGYTVLAKVEKAPPTAELGGAGRGAEQTDEEDMGMSYEELSYFGKLRKISRCGPVSMVNKLVYEWPHLSPSVVGEKVKKFFFYYSINRHKMTTLTPSYHAENYSPEDNRFDLRQFLYNARWSWQYRKVDEAVARLERLDDMRAAKRQKVKE
jgi:NAD+ synthase (glutamine-hydrolysing)|eukprot:CAMPEP_0174286310 /NCGR_PEP_ID=MMETSP0809-20121228/11346_1 /TAXON_ID=73025 ORGANISM="Eutreptiella gymnastica-like, Strain CCMP1594" /NCGR_SAMPLE_ID=MMETSP0809 /ASSEMBLY_ACC=CAM_ASM_000658 /LENGTH=708 /DNA_ID=CAMNT_0015382329 /DNA_START=23 /DNA_END=2149 /DNA_ORIENTATION=-